MHTALSHSQQATQQDNSVGDPTVQSDSAAQNHTLIQNQDLKQNPSVVSDKVITTNNNSAQKIRLTLARWGKECIIFFVIFVGILAWQQKDMLSTDGSVVVPNAEFVSINGETQALLASDKPTLLYFFAPWCKVCELSVSNVDTFDPNQVSVVKVALEYASAEEVAIFANKTQTQRNIVFGTKAVQKQFAVSAFPSVYIVQPNGTIVGRSVGYTTSLGYKLRVAFGTQ